MGVLPVAFNSGVTIDDLSLEGNEKISILGINDEIQPYQPLKLFVQRSGGNNETIDVTLQIYTDNEIEYIKHGSILGSVIKNLSEKS